MSVLSEGPTLLTQLRAMVMALVMSTPATIMMPAVKIIMKMARTKKANSATSFDWGMLCPLMLHGQHGVGVQNLAEVVAHHLQQHDAAYALEAAAGAAGAGAEIHDDAEDDPRDVRPLSYVVAEHAGGGDERHHLEQR